MAVREIPARKLFICDGCGNEAESRMPSNWTTLDIKANAIDFQGVAVADASVHRILCARCTPVVHKAINEAIAGLEKQA